MTVQMEAARYPLCQWQSLSGIHQESGSPIAVRSLAYSWGCLHSQRAYSEAKAKVANSALKMVTAATANLADIRGSHPHCQNLPYVNTQQKALGQVADGPVLDSQL
jgi:hypothetical protein